MKRILLALLAVSILAAPAAAGAKQISSATVCGASGCNDATHPAAFFPALEGGPPSGGGPLRAHRFYRLRVVVDEGSASEAMRLLAVPHGNYVRGPDGVWRQTGVPVLHRIVALAGDLRPFPASRLPDVSNAPQPFRADPLPSPPPNSAAHERSFPWIVAGLAAATALIVVSLAVARRRRGEAKRAQANPRSAGAPTS